MKLINELYNYREMIFSLVRRDLKGRYKGSVLGFLWTFLNPLFQLGIYTLVFSVILDGGVEDYYMFLFVALVPWIFFSTSVLGGATCIWDQQDLVKKNLFSKRGAAYIICIKSAYKHDSKYACCICISCVFRQGD